MAAPTPKASSRAATRTPSASGPGNDDPRSRCRPVRRRRSVELWGSDGPCTGRLRGSAGGDRRPTLRAPGERGQLPAVDLKVLLRHPATSAPRRAGVPTLDEVPASADYRTCRQSRPTMPAKRAWGCREVTGRALAGRSGSA
jgi:hypothetical protein